MIINDKTKYVLNCENPNTTSKSGWIIQFTIHLIHRFNTSIHRDSIKWQKLYRLRTICETSICQVKNFIEMKASKVKNTVFLKSDILHEYLSLSIAFILIFKAVIQRIHLLLKL